MNIYDEAIENTQTLMVLVNLKELNSKKKLDMLNQIEKALERAKKVEMETFTIQELKELLKGLNVKKGNKIYLIINDTLQYYEDDEELEEME